jgi:5-hydroxyisourate hydrolase
MGRLTTHVLDTTLGRPGSGIDVSVARIEGGTRQLVAAARTNADGRCDRPLLEGDALIPGVYEITFAVAPYHARCGVALAEPPFVGDVVLRFGVADGSQHYHVPLLVTPWSYSTYRGS